MQFTIYGRTFSAIEKYEVGRVITAAEANVLNRTMVKLIRDRFNRKKRELANEEQHRVQLAIDREIEEFDFNPGVRKEAVAIARAILKQAIKNMGGKLSDYSKASITEGAYELLDGDQGDAILVKARRLIENITHAGTKR